MENLNNVPSTGTFGNSVQKINSNFDLIVNAINSLEYQTTRSKGILNYGQNPATVFPNAAAGDWCMILSEGNVFPATIKTYNGSTWSGSGIWNPEGVDLTQYAKTTDMNTAIANSLAQATARMGYGKCTVSGTALTVSIPNFILPTSGGTIHIKMSAAGTGASTLNINNTGAKTLWYNGAAVSAQNTWEADEIISVFYDGTRFMASNSQGGGGNAEKISYDNSQSGLSADNVQGALDEMDEEVTELAGELYNEVSVDISGDYDITNGQAYGNVGSVISTDTNSQFSKVYIAKDDDLKAVFTTHSSADVSSYVQFVRGGNIITRRLYISGDYVKGTEYEIALSFEENEIGVYVSGTHGSVKVYGKQYTNKFLQKSDVVDEVVNEEMPISSKAIYDSFLVEGPSSQIPVKGMQAYGSVGQTISIASGENFEYIRLPKGTPYKVTFKTLPSSARVISYVQYVKTDNVVTRILYTSAEGNTDYTFEPEFIGEEIAVYISSARGFLQVSEKSMEIQSVKNLLRVSQPIQSEYSKTDAETNFYYSTLNKCFLHGEIGQVLQELYDRNGPLCLKIPLADVKKITYPLFATTSGYGSMVCASGDIVLWFYANTTEPDGTYKTIDVSSISGAEYAYISIYGVSDYHITIEKKESVDTKLFLEELLSSDFTTTAPNKALSLTGANLLYQLISNVNIGGVPAGGLHCFNDFGEMPSCVYGDANAFLEDGVDGSGNAIIKYSDVIAKYDALVSAYPAFVTKQTLGYDASNTIEMYSYTFTPKYYKQCIYLQAGVHGWEPDPVFALAEIMYLICNAYGSEYLSPTIINNNVLKYIRGNVKIVVVPVVNPWGFNNRADCGIDKRQQAQNNYNGVQLNSAWSGDEPECVYVRNIISSISSELSFAIDMHSTVHTNSLTRYGCFYGGVNRNAKNVPTIYRTYEWLYEFYNAKYPSIVQGATVPNPTSGGYASVGYMTGTFNSWIYTTYSVQASTMEFSDHVWTTALHTSTALSVAVNMYLNQIVQQLNDEYKNTTPTDIPAADYYPARG